MKFTKSKREPKKSPEEEYAKQISTLSENELRDLHKDLKIDHYGNSTAAVINTASGVGLFSMRSTTRRYRTECMQIEVIEARMKENGWTPHPNRYRDAVPIALGVAAGTTSGMTFGLINVEKNAKRTKDYMKKKDLFKTKELVETKDIQAETEKDEAVGKAEAAESPVEHPQALETTTEPVVSEHSILRKPVSAPTANNTEAETSQAEGLCIVVGESSITKDTSVVAAELITTDTHPPPAHAPCVDASPTTEPTTPKKATLFSPLSVMNKKMLRFRFKKDRAEKEKTVSVTEIAPDADSPVVSADVVVSHGAVVRLDSQPVYTPEVQECVA